MKLLGRIARIMGSVLILSHAPIALSDVGLKATCPSDAPASSTIETDIVLTNSICPPAVADVRVIASVVGNANDSVGGLGIFGPVVIAEETVPAGTQTNVCVSNQCTETFNQCTTDVDCCFSFYDGPPVVPGITNLPTHPTPPPVPASLQGTVATYMLVTELQGDVTQVEECLVNVVAADCGDGELDPGEECDDGNNVSGDGCAGDCTNE